jgi:hypothetical protein
LLTLAGHGWLAQAVYGRLQGVSRAHEPVGEQQSTGLGRPAFNQHELAQTAVVGGVEEFAS